MYVAFGCPLHVVEGGTVTSNCGAKSKTPLLQLLGAQAFSNTCSFHSMLCLPCNCYGWLAVHSILNLLLLLLPPCFSFLSIYWFHLFPPRQSLLLGFSNPSGISHLTTSPFPPSPPAPALGHRTENATEMRIQRFWRGLRGVRGLKVCWDGFVFEASKLRAMASDLRPNT